MYISHLRVCCLSLFVILAGFIPAAGQFEGDSLRGLTLEDLDGFRAPGTNWQIVGGVSSDRTVHHDISTTAGRGVLANLPSEEAAHLTTEWEHGDIRLAMDVMVPRGSNSGIYLQGRYEIQILDSWGVAHPTYGDMGGIYQRWDASRPSGSEGFQGKPPRMNAARAPGLWQRLTVDFRAPRFDEEGTKTANARIRKITLNGVTVHEGVSVTGPTRGSTFEGEAPRGPIVIQGDHGPVAFRNISYERYRSDRTVAPDSLAERTLPNPITVEPEGMPRIVRSYVFHRGEKRTHVVSVGDPAGVHYTYDLERGSLLKVWKGPFAETTDMWNGRGIEQVLRPRGSVVERRGGPDVAALEWAESDWPDSLRGAYEFRYLGYDLDDSGRPRFLYRLGDARVEDRIEPTSGGLRRVIQITESSASLWMRLAAGERIRSESDTIYRIDGESYYLQIDEAGGAAPLLRATPGGSELLLQLDPADTTVSYSLIW